MSKEIRQIEFNGKEYPLLMSINVIIDIEDEYGSFENWSALVTPKEGEGALPNMTAIRKFFTLCVNEGIDVENEDAEIKRPFITEKQAGRIMGGLQDSRQVVMDLVVSSTKTGNEEEDTGEAESKNEETTQAN